MSLYEVNVVRGECGKLGRFYMRRRQFECDDGREKSEIEATVMVN
jgi:hypothetical protein